MLPGARVSSAPLPLVCDQFDHSLFAAAHAARPVALTCAAREECSTVTNDALKSRTDRMKLACTDTSSLDKKAARTASKAV